MADKLEGMPSTMQLTDPETGQINDEWFTFFEELVFGSSARSVGTILSGLTSTTAKTDNIISGAQALDDVNISGRGSLIAEQDAQNNSAGDAADAAAVASGSFSVSADKTALEGSATGGTIESNIATISVSGGTAPYSLSASLRSGDTVTATFSPTSLSSDGDFTVKFSKTWVSEGFFTGVQKITITDSAGSPMSRTVNLSFTLFDSVFF